MIIDCDTHFLPPDAYDYMGREWDKQRPRFVWDDKELIWSGNALRLLGCTE
jgi:hypothetical protein